MLSEKQSKVLIFVRENGSITTRLAVGLIGYGIYANKAFHVGNVLRRMVKRGLLIRESKGVYVLPPPPVWDVSLPFTLKP